MESEVKNEAEKEVKKKTAEMLITAFDESRDLADHDKQIRDEAYQQGKKDILNKAIEYVDGMKVKGGQSEYNAIANGMLKVVKIALEQMKGEQNE